MAGKKGQGQVPKKIIEKLKDLFLEGGMTPYRASLILNIDNKTASKYFREFADELIQSENHEDWFDREARARQRALEGLSTQINEVRKILESFELKLKKLLAKKDFDLDTIVPIEKIVRLNRKFLVDLIDEYDAVDMTPPMIIILEKEMEARIAAKNYLGPKYNSKE